ncbi:MAG: cell wall hydrolase [Sphingomonadaceae bacterium]|nr:cell wall hydrolase [Sphingomonadaceae bacterium]
MPQNWWELYPEVLPQPAVGSMPMPGPAFPNVPINPTGEQSGPVDSFYLSGYPTSNPTSGQRLFSSDGYVPNVDRDMAIHQAGAAIRRGADLNAIRARLNQIGVDADLEPPDHFSDLIPAGRPALQLEQGPDSGSGIPENVTAFRNFKSPAGDKAYRPPMLEQAALINSAPRRGDAQHGGRARSQSFAADQGSPGINGYGYVPPPSDANLLRRFLYAELSSSDNWRDMPAAAWTAINRIRPNGNWPRYRTMDTIGTSLTEVLNKRARNGTPQYSWLPSGGIGAPGGSLRWQESAHPERLTGNARQAWLWAGYVADRVLGGTMRDPTGGATYFHNRSVGVPPKVDGWFGRSTTITPSPYRSPNGQNFFYRHVEDPLRPTQSSPPRRGGIGAARGVVQPSILGWLGGMGQ